MREFRERSKIPGIGSLTGRDHGHSNRNSTAFLESRDISAATTGGRPRSDAFCSLPSTSSRRSTSPPASNISRRWVRRFLQTRGGGIYEPFSWIVWGWRYCTSQDERIRRPFFEGEMIVFAGSFLASVFSSCSQAAARAS